MTNLLDLESTTKPYNPQEWQRGYESQPNEYAYEIDEIEGEIPRQLEGTLFRNGPGLLDIGGTPIGHPFDGDGMVNAFYFKDGRAYFRNRFVRTEGYIREQQAGEILYRGVFGTQKPGGWLNNAFDLRRKNIANTNVIYWGDKLVALWEAAEPHRLDPYTLETLGIDYLDGILQPGDSFAAHPWIDPSCELDNGAPCLVNFSIEPGLSSKITVYEIAPNGKLLRRYAHSVPGFCFIHDFAITPNYCIFFQNPVTLNPIPYVLGFRGAGECINFQSDRPTQVILIPRTPPHREVKVFSVQSGFVFHHANAFECLGCGNLLPAQERQCFHREDKVIIDSVAYASLPQVQPDSDYKEVNFEALAPGQLWRFTLNLADNTVENKLLESRCCEFPFVNPANVGREYRYLFLGAAHNSTGNAPLQAMLKLDLQTGQRQLYSFAPKGYVSEPIFVPKPDATAEDEGWLFTLVYNAAHHRSDLVILDGENLEKGPVTCLHLKHHIPYGLHGSWCDAVALAPRRDRYFGQ